MNKQYNTPIGCTLLICLVMGLLPVMVKAQSGNEYTGTVNARIANSEKKTWGPWKAYPTRSIATLNGFTKGKAIGLDQYGGRKDRKATATGFYHVTKINGRWWAVDPDGYLYINVGLVDVAPGGSDRNKAYLKQGFGTPQEWAEKTQQMLFDYGFNSLGAWSAVDLFRQTRLQASRPVSYTIIKDFMSAYGKKRGGTYQDPGHTGYPDKVTFVFDPAFETFCDEYAQQLAVNKDDQNLFGYFSDNELPFDRLSLDRYLGKKDTTDYGYQAARQWLANRHIEQAAITDSTRNEFLGVIAERYFSIVSKAIKKYDPNHLYLGSRFHSYEKKVPQVFKAAGKYVDLIAVNYYREWTPTPEDVHNWEAWSGKPFIITEWYTKGEDSGMPDYSGAGWEVPTQAERGLFYQNFSLGLLESGNCVGFHWFKYQDNDPTNTHVDPSNTDANKGIVNYQYGLYKDLVNRMKEVNDNVYSLIDFFDGRK